MAGILREKGAFTNTATFDLKCEVGHCSFVVFSDESDSGFILYSNVDLD
jgi:hypothetical protein